MGVYRQAPLDNTNLFVLPRLSLTIAGSKVHVGEVVPAYHHQIWGAIEDAKVKLMTSAIQEAGGIILSCQILSIENNGDIGTALAWVDRCP